MSFRTILLCVLGGLILALPIEADVFRPAYLSLKQTGAESYEVMWKVPALDADTTLKVKPQFPAGAEETTPRSSIFAAGASVQRWQVRVPGGLDGKPITFTHLTDTGLDVLVRVERLDGTEQLGRILPVEPSFTAKASPGRLEVVTTYTVLGIGHILLGVDHLLFVLALIMIVGSVRQLVITVTAFTLAHSITLALATLGVVEVPGAPVEAIIALSIVFVASEILHLRQGRASLTARKPWLVAFTFGLLHGLGFAGALAEVGLPQNAVPLALLFFNVGVEIGQLVFISAVLAFIFLSRKFLSDAVLKRAPALFAYGIGGMASYWVIERTLSFWTG